LSVKQLLIQKVVANQSIEFKKTNWEHVIHELKAYVNYFQENNVNIIFFEMPTEELVLNSELYEYMRLQLKEKFHDIEFIPAKPLITTDGLHIEPIKAHQFMQELLFIIGKHKKDDLLYSIDKSSKLNK